MTQREMFEESIRKHQGTHGMLGDLSRDANGEYRSACERSAWWAWQMLCPEGHVVVEESVLDEMAEDSRFLCALRNAGVDNWQGYEEAQAMIEEWDAEDEEDEE